MTHPQSTEFGPVQPADPSKTSDRDFVRLVGIGDVHLGADNIVSALEYFERARVVAKECGAPHTDRIEVELKIIDALVKQSSFGEAIGLAQRLASDADSVADPRLRARVIARLGTVQSGLQRYEDARETCLEAYEILRHTDANREVGALELTLGAIAHLSGRFEDAHSRYTAALSTFRRIDDSEGIARALNNLGTLLIYTPRWGEGREYLIRAIAVAEETGNYARIASLCLNLGILAYRTGEWDLSANYLSRSLQIAKETAPLRVVRVQLAMGRLKISKCEFSEAESHLRHALASARERQDRREEALAYEFLGELCLRTHELEKAETFLGQGRTVAKSLSAANDIVGEIATRQAELALLRNDAVRAKELAEEALQVTNVINDSIERGRAHRILGAALLDLSETDEAAVHLSEAVLILEGTSDVIELEMARCARAIGWSRTGEKDGTRVASSLEQSSRRFLELRLPHCAVGALHELAKDAQRRGSIDQALTVVDQALQLVDEQGCRVSRAGLENLRIELEEKCIETSLTRSAEFQLLNEVANYDRRDPNAAIASFLKLAAERSGSDRVMIAVNDRSLGIRVEDRCGFKDEKLPSKSLIASVFGRFEDGRQIVVLGAADATDRPLTNSGIKVNSAVAVPISVGEKTSALLYADRHDRDQESRFRSADLRLLSFFAGILGVFISAREGERRLQVDRDTGPEPEDALASFHTCDAEMKRSIHLLRKLNRSDAGVLVTGETGTGKGLLARLIHESSLRARGTFVPVNCAALPEALLESELFGHEQGAFTGAVRKKQGLFEEAEGGTLFLDEVDKAPIGVQAKLLHVLDKHEIRPVGSTHWKPVDVRVVCATNADLLQFIDDGKFLEDLYYRLNDFQVHIPPLRDRREDIPLLVRHFVSHYSEPLKRKNVVLTRAAIEALTDHEWRGNVRELEKVVKRILVLAEDGDAIGVAELPREIQAPVHQSPHSDDDVTLRTAVQRVESELIATALEATGGNKSEVARRLEVSYPCLLSKIKKYGLEPRRR